MHITLSVTEVSPRLTKTFYYLKLPVVAAAAVLRCVSLKNWWW